MRIFKFILFCFLLVFCNQNVLAQGIRVFKKNNVVVDIPYMQLDSIVAYGYEDNNDVEMWVDLGLPSRTLWASCNLGASSPEDYGYYFAWGETEIKDTYSYSNSVTYNKKFEDISGVSQYDAVAYRYGNPMSLPTLNQFNELIENCTLEWTIQNGVWGQLITSKLNGRSIFLPASGQKYFDSLVSIGDGGWYWASTPYMDFFDSYNLFLNSEGINCYDHNKRYLGFNVRAVQNDVHDTHFEPLCPGGMYFYADQTYDSLKVFSFDPWTAEIEATNSWFNITPTSCEARPGSSTLTRMDITMPQNTTGKNHRGRIIVKTYDNNAITMPIFQSSWLKIMRPTPIITDTIYEEQSVYFNQTIQAAQTTETIVFHVYQDGAKLTKDSDWFTFDQDTFNKGYHTVNLKIQQNESYSERKGMMLLTSGDVSTPIYLTQEKKKEE